jgi:hypothetical protein
MDHRCLGTRCLLDDDGYLKICSIISLDGISNVFV